MTHLEAEWDPVAGKVVYRDVAVTNKTTTVTRETTPTKIESDQPNNNDKQPIVPLLPIRSSTKNRRRSRTKKLDKTSFDWRVEDVNIQSKPNNDDAKQNRGISPSRFHSSDAKDPVPPYHLETTIKIRRKELDYERRAFKELTSSRSFPLQEHAINWCHQLFKEWGKQVQVVEGETIEDDVISDDHVKSSSSGTMSPEPKRCIRASNTTPTESTMLQQFRNKFINERITVPKSIPATQTLGTAIYCLEPRIFAIESKKSTKMNRNSTLPLTDTNGGRRRYVVAHIGRFMDTYWSKTEPDWRHAYELIPPCTPCRLYLDIECTDHPSLIGFTSTVRTLQHALLTELFEELAIEIQNMFGDHIIHCPNTNRSYSLRPLQRQDIVDLDSSTETKFSRHWIVHIPVTEETIGSTSVLTSEALFPDNAAIGMFVRQWVGRMAEQHATGQLQQTNRSALMEYLFLPKKSKTTSTATDAIDKTCCLIDMGVYTRNRLFRLMGSMKFGKPVTAAFRIADSNQFPFSNNFSNDCFYVPAMKQKEQQQTNSSEVDRTSDASMIKKSLSKTDWSSHANALTETFVVPINVEKIDYPILPRLVLPDESDLFIRSLKSGVARPTGHAMTTFYGISPYPMVDEFVQHHLANRGGTVGSIRAWSIDVNPTTSKPLVISYQMCHNRWCECIGREHKSNNIIWNCNLISMECYQTCHDPDCRALSFRGRPIPLPMSVQDELRDSLFEEDLARLDITDILLQESSSISQHVDVDVNDDDDSSFDNALATLNLNALLPSSSMDTITKPEIPSPMYCVNDISNKTIILPSNDEHILRKKNAQIRHKHSSSLLASSSDDDSDDDLIQLARQIEKRKERKKQIQ
jgi:DNA-directed primase/polymerase protein